MAGVKGRSGRKKNPTNVARYLTEQIDDHWGELVDAFIQQALKGDREMLLACFDRRLGKVKTSIELEGGQELTAAIVTRLFAVLAEQQRARLCSPNLSVYTLDEYNPIEYNGESGGDYV